MKQRFSFKQSIFAHSQFVWGFLCLLIIVSPANGIGDDCRLGAANFRLKAGHGIGELDSLIGVYSMTLFDSIPSRKTYFSEFPDTIAVDTVVSALENEDCILWAEPDHYLYNDTNDSLYGDQWHLEHQENPGNPWADIQASIC